MQASKLPYKAMPSGSALASTLPLTPEDVPQDLKRRRSKRTVEIICQRYETYLQWIISRRMIASPDDSATLECFIEDMEDKEGYKYNTVRAYLWAISAVHTAFKLRDPTIDAPLRDAVELMRRRQEAQRQRTKTLSEDDIRRILSVLPSRRRTKFGWLEEYYQAEERAAVDTALLLTMTQAALRRSEAQALTWGDIRRYRDGTGRITIPSRKTSKSVPNYVAAVTEDCVLAIETLRPYGAVNTQKVFSISPTQLIKRLKVMCAAAQIDPENVTARTPRESLVRIMVENGAPFDLIQRQARLRSSSMVQAFISDDDAGEALDWMFSPHLQ